MSLKSFKLWLEAREGNKRVARMLMKRLGFRPDAVDNSALKLRSLDKERLTLALSQMGLGDEKSQDLQNWVRNNPDGTIQNLLDQMSDRDIAPPDDAEDMDLPSAPASLPQGTPKPQGQPQQVQFGSNLGQMPPQPPMV